MLLFNLLTAIGIVIIISAMCICAYLETSSSGTTPVWFQSQFLVVVGGLIWILKERIDDMGHHKKKTKDEDDDGQGRT